MHNKLHGDVWRLKLINNNYTYHKHFQNILQRRSAMYITDTVFKAVKKKLKFSEINL